MVLPDLGAKPLFDELDWLNGTPQAESVFFEGTSIENVVNMEQIVDSDYDVITDVINARLDTQSKYILSDFTFGATNYAGGVKTGSITWNSTTGAVTGGTGVVINRNGMVGALAGATTFSITTDGTATFAGTLTAASGSLGAITIGTNAWHVDSSGNMWWGNFANYAAATIKISSAGAVDFTTGNFTGVVTVGPSDGVQAQITGSPGYGVIKLIDDDNSKEASIRMTADDDPTYPSQLQIDADDGQVWQVGGTAIANLGSGGVYLIGGTSGSLDLYPNTDEGWTLGGASNYFYAGYFGSVFAKGYTCRTGTSGSYGANNFNLHWNGSATELYIDVTDTGDITVSSDKRLKKNIKSLDNSSVLDKVSQFKPVAYEFIHGRKQQRYGLTAQQVEKISPELVRTIDIESKEAPDGIKTIDYHSIISMLVSCVQELNNKLKGNDGN